MNWVFWFLIALGLIFLWITLRYSFKDIGAFFIEIIKEIKDKIE